MSNEFELFDFREAPVRSIFTTGFLTAINITLNFGIATILEGIFPAYSAKKNVWLGALEAVTEIVILVVATTAISAFGGINFSTGMVFATMIGIYLLGGAWQKLQALRMRLMGRQSS